jgi:hypothetical protein
VGRWQPSFASDFVEQLPRPQDASSIPAPAHAAVRGAIDRAFPDRDAVMRNFVGDAAHMAATAQGVLYWGDHAGSPELGTGDLGGWALDLATFWRKFRESGSGSVEDFTRAHLGNASDTNTFPEDDLYADADGWLVGRSARSGATADAAYRRVYRDHPSANERLKTFLQARFGSRQDFARVVVDMFSREINANGLSVLTFTATAKWPAPNELTELAETSADVVFKKAGM